MKPAILLAEKWDRSINPEGFWMSEKADGVRAFWDGQRLISRAGNAFAAPDWFTDRLPPTPLDGELWFDRNQFQKTLSIVNCKSRSEHWREMRFLVFDAPTAAGAFEQRSAAVSDLIADSGCSFAVAMQHVVCSGLDHLTRELRRVESLGGEGLMLRAAGSLYEPGRSPTLLKVKSRDDAEAIVIAYECCRGRLKSLIVQLENGPEFSVASGLAASDRARPPAIGSMITFWHQGYTGSGLPRFPVFARNQCNSGL